MDRRDFLFSSAAAPLAAQQAAAAAQPDILVIVSDTLRKGFLAPYGNRVVRTPNLAALAAESAVFERHHPECLPTIPTRRTLHSGRRAFPFRNYQPVPWDNVYLPGWQPMSPNEDTVAESLARAGYHCCFASDVPHYFVPGQNFTRGFHQWDFIRGNAEDRYRSPAAFDQARVKQRYESGRGPMQVANLGGFEPGEMAFATPRTFLSVMKYVEENRTNPKPLYLYVDTFHPHESWEAPREYYDLYRDPAYKGKTYLTVPYRTLHDVNIPEESLQDIRAHYSGLITMVDHWVGRLLAKVRESGRGRETLILFGSDHGTNFGDNLERVIGKPAGALYPGTMDIPLIVRHPGRKGAGKRFPQLTYTVDVPATVCAAAGVAPKHGLDGRNLLPLLEGGRFEAREYVTCRYSNCVWYRDDKNWFFSNIHWQNQRLFDLEATEPFAKTIAKAAPERVALARKRILQDAGGDLPVYPLKPTDQTKAPFI
ncbi:MAG: sulfatase [Acidobacteria bacterium]|nr:sulfatase [Acidobacteriota bacterium]MBI3279049.1 sulfatase [Acidobacteriota bacterium]